MTRFKLKKILPVIICIFLLASCARNHEGIPSDTPSTSRRTPTRPTRESVSSTDSEAETTSPQDESEESDTDNTSYEGNTGGTSKTSGKKGTGSTAGSTGSTVNHTTGSTENDQSTEKPQVFNGLKRGINFSGSFQSSDLAAYDSWVFDAKYYQTIKSRGFDHIRLPINFPDKTGDAPDYIVDNEFFRQIDIGVDLALDAGLAVVLDMHGFTGLMGNVDGLKGKFYKIWEQIANRYQRYPETLLFEVLNEPSKPSSGVSIMTTAKLNELQLEVIRIIRKTNPTRKIVATVMDNNGVWNIWNMTLPDNDKNILITIHAYDTMAYTHQGATWSDPSRNHKVPFDDKVKTSIISTLDKAKDYQDRTGRTVWIGEWGVYLGIADKDQVAEYAEFFRTAAEERNLAWCWWEFCSGFGLYDRTTESWKPNIVNRLLGD